MATKSESSIAAQPEAERMVRVRLPKENPKQEDAVVWVNERRYIIKRGVYVEVPLSVYEVLEHAEKMEEKAVEFAAAFGG